MAASNLSPQFHATLLQGTTDLLVSAQAKYEDALVSYDGIQQRTKYDEGHSE